MNEESPCKALNWVPRTVENNFKNAPSPQVPMYRKVLSSLIWPMSSGCSRFPLHFTTPEDPHVSGLECQWPVATSGSSRSQRQAWEWEELCQTSLSCHSWGFIVIVSSVLNYFHLGRSKGVARALSDVIICFIFLLENRWSQATVMFLIILCSCKLRMDKAFSTEVLKCAH